MPTRLITARASLVALATEAASVTSANSGTICPGSPEHLQELGALRITNGDPDDPAVGREPPDQMTTDEPGPAENGDHPTFHDRLPVDPARRTA